MRPRECAVCVCVWGMGGGGACVFGGEVRTEKIMIKPENREQLWCVPHTHTHTSQNTINCISGKHMLTPPLVSGFDTKDWIRRRHTIFVPEFFLQTINSHLQSFDAVRSEWARAHTHMRTNWNYERTYISFSMAFIKPASRHIRRAGECLVYVCVCVCACESHPSQQDNNIISADCSIYVRASYIAIVCSTDPAPILVIRHARRKFIINHNWLYTASRDDVRHRTFLALVIVIRTTSLKCGNFPKEKRETEGDDEAASLESSEFSLPIRIESNENETLIQTTWAPAHTYTQ